MFYAVLAILQQYNGGERKRERVTDRQTDRQTDKQTDRQKVYVVHSIDKHGNEKVNDLYYLSNQVY